MSNINQPKNTSPAAPGGPGIATDPARDAAITYLARQAGRFPNLDLAPLDSTHLPARDAALAHAIVDAVLRRWLTLRLVVQARLTQAFDALEPAMRAALLAGAAQILLLERVPAYAAIDHAVGWAKRTIRPGAGGMVNAVLRRVAELRAAVDAPGAGDGGESPGPGARPYTGSRSQLPVAWGAVELTEPLFPEDPVERLAVATGHPRHQIDLWTASFGADGARQIAMHGLAPPPSIVRLPRDRTITAEPAALQPHDVPGFAVTAGPRASLLALLTENPDLWVQDPSSAAAVESVADLQPDLIVDVCAGQGTKTRQLAAAFPNARIVATDKDESRRAALARVFKGHPRVLVTTLPRVIECAGKADLIVLDVPCSNSGVYGRRPEAKYRFNRGSIRELQSLQRQIIADAIPLMSERGNGGLGGLILYSTCSLEPAENRAQVEWVAQWHKFGAARERLTLPRGGPGHPPTSSRDGSYSVLLGRRVPD